MGGIELWNTSPILCPVGRFGLRENEEEEGGIKIRFDCEQRAATSRPINLRIGLKSYSRLRRYRTSERACARKDAHASSLVYFESEKIVEASASISP
ncbi:hypothetical protein KM043_017410 [Ampulex compressa]|nr:hypothetical protein KM043_017410 [Ampulex compressa]